MTNIDRKKTWGDYTVDDDGKIMTRTINGITFYVKGAETEDYINAIKTINPDIMINDMSDRIEIFSNRTGTTKPIDDTDETIILNRLKDYGLRGDTRMRGALVELAAINRYHPVKQYLGSLQWDGKDHFASLMNKLEMSSPIADVFWRKFLIGSIAKAIDGHQNFMLVLLGAQGKGKSRLVRWLCPLKNLFNEGPIHPDDKDYLIKLINNWLWEVAELDATTRKADRSALKHFISTPVIDVRVPYGRYSISKPSAASMIGTINPDGTGFLSDPSGNRRFGVVTMEDIDWSYTDIDIHQLWAQLYTAYKDGETWELTHHEQEIQAEINLNHSSSSPLEMFFNQFFTVDPSSEDYLSAADILVLLQKCGFRGNQYTASKELPSILVKLGASKKRKKIGDKYQRVWIGVKKNIELINEQEDYPGF